MTEKELEKKAEEYAKEQEEYCILGVYDGTAELEYDRGYNIGYINGLEEGFIAGAKEMQKENEELKVQIEKMKCSGNCQTWNEWQCPYARNREKEYVHPNKDDCPCDKWKIKGFA